MEEVKITGINDGALVIELSGDIDLGNAEAFYAAVMDGYKASPADICFVCDTLNFIDSTTLGTFVKILKQIKANGHTLRLTGSQSKIKKLFVICSLDTVMDIA
jgi:anti-sigma B factor antagonist